MTPRALPGITVVVCTRDRPALLEQCLRSVSAQSYPVFDILVVENSVHEESVELARETCRRWGAAHAVVRPPGLTRARNAGARLARGEIVAYLDDDAVAEPGWLSALAEDLSDPEVVAVTGRIRSMKARGESRELTDEISEHQVQRLRRTFDRSVPDWFTVATFGGVGDGGNMAIRRTIVAEAQPFDERLGSGRLIAGGDEHAMFAGLLSRGYRIVHNPNAVVRHPSPPTPDLQRRRKYEDVRSAIAYLLFTWKMNPGHRVDLLGFLARAIQRRAIGAPGLHPSIARLSRLQLLTAMVSGVALYRRARREWKRSNRIESTEIRSILADEFEPRAAVR